MLHLGALGYGYYSFSREIRDVCHFTRGSLWDTSLAEMDVIVVYGLHPIMKNLRKKISEECRPGTVVVSNVFEFPNWKHIERHSKAKVFVYKVGEGEGE